jgi:hypothetical protein
MKIETRKINDVRENLIAWIILSHSEDVEKFYQFFTFYRGNNDAINLEIEIE